MFFIHCKNHDKCQLLAGLLLYGGLSLIAVQAAEVRYVTDQLTLNMYKDTTLNQRLPALKSGDRVEVIKLAEGYTQVKTDKGIVGWVKSSYLDEESPARVRLAALQEELDALRSRHADLLIGEDKQPPKADETLQARVVAAEASRQRMKQRLAELELERNRHIMEIRELKKQLPEESNTKPILLWIILPLLTLISGFFMGLKYLDAKIRARFGGFSPI